MPGASGTGCTHVGLDRPNALAGNLRSWEDTYEAEEIGFFSVSHRAVATASSVDGGTRTLRSLLGVAALVACFAWITPGRQAHGEETFPTSVVTEASVGDTEDPDVWVSLDVYSEQPFLYNSASRAIYTHPQMPFGAQIDSFEFGGEDDERVFEKRQIFGYRTYEGRTALSDGVSDVAAAFLPYEHVEGWLYWQSGTANRTFLTRIHYVPLYIGVQCRTSDGTIVTSTYPLWPDRIQNWTSVTDFLNAKYEISLYYYQGGVPTVPVPDTEARVGFFHYVYPTLTLLYATPWATTNAAGRADSTMGTGAYTIPISGNVPLDKVTIEITPMKEDASGSSNAYVEKKLTIDNMATFDGDLTVTVTDVDGTPLRAYVKCTGGPIGINEPPMGITDESGEITLHLPKHGTGADTRSVEAHVAPSVLIVSDVTQYIDGVADGELHAKAPVYFSPHFQLMDGAYTYKNKAPSDPIVRIYVDGTQDGGDFDSQTIKRDDDYTRAERMKGINRLFFPVAVDDTPKDYTCRVYFEDDDEGVEEDEMLAGHTNYTPRTVKEARVPSSDTPLHFQYVGVVGLGTPPTGTGSILSRCLSGAQQAEWNAFVQKFVPRDVVFTNGPDVTPDTWFFEADGYRIGGVFRELENWRRAQTTHIDVVVGIVSPGGCSSYLTGGASGLSLPGYEHVVLIDPSGGLAHKEHILLHEFLHTLGLPDRLGAPPSANGYDPDTDRAVYNGMGIQSAQAIMFDASSVAWPTSEEYYTLLETQTLPLADTKMRNAKRTPTQVMHVSAMFHRVPNDAAPGTWKVELASRAPLFIDTGEPYAPTDAPPNNGMNGRAYGLVVSDESSDLVRAYEILTAPLINDEGDPALDDSLMGFISFAIPWDDAARAIGFGAFDHTGAMTGIVYGCDVERSDTAPTVAWTSKPADGATLSGQAVFEWQASDPDYKPTLYAWVKLSTDGGTTWRAAGNYFSIDQGPTSYTLDCVRFPESADCRIKVLVSDDWYTRTIEAGPYTLDGYDPDPEATIVDASIDLAARIPGTVQFPIRIENTGADCLDVYLSTATLPSWLHLEGAFARRRIVPGARESFSFSCASTVTQTFSGSVAFTSNDPERPAFQSAVSIAFDDQNHAPRVLSLGAWGLPDGARTASPESIVFLAREAAGMSDLSTTLTIRQRFPYERIVASALAMQPGQTPGEYRYDWAPGGLGAGVYGAEVAMADAASGLSDTDGSNSTGDDFTFEVVRPNAPPVFTSLSPDTDPTSYVAVLGGDNFALRFALSDPDGDPLTLSLDCDMPSDIDAQAGVIDLFADVNAVGKQTVRLAATDPFGAQSVAIWYVDVEPPWVPDIARAVPDVQSGTVVVGDTFRLGASCYNLDPQQGCRVDYRPEGAANWTTIGTYAYDNQESYVQYTNSHNWDVTHLSPGAPCELRYVNINASGQEDAQPPVVVIRRRAEDASVVRVSAPAYLMPGQRFTLSVEVLNRSTQTWTPGGGYSLMPQGGGADPLTGAASVAMGSGISVPPGARALYSVEATAPLTPGRYISAWRHASPETGRYGDAGGAIVVVGAEALPEPSEAAWMLY